MMMLASALLALSLLRPAQQGWKTDARNSSDPAAGFAEGLRAIGTEWLIAARREGIEISPALGRFAPYSRHPYIRYSLISFRRRRALYLWKELVMRTFIRWHSPAPPPWLYSRLRDG